MLSGNGVSQVSKEQILEELVSPDDRVDAGYALAEVDYAECCRWPLDCAEHVLVLIEKVALPEHFSQLKGALQGARSYLDGEVEAKEVQDSWEITGVIFDQQLEAQGSIGSALADALEAASCAIQMVLPDSGVYHEDVIYAAARAAFAAELHPADALRKRLQ